MAQASRLGSISVSQRVQSGDEQGQTILQHSDRMLP